MPSTLIFVSAAMLLGVMTHLCIPFLSEVAGLESIIFWFICGGLGVFTPLIIAGVMTLRKEGGKFTKETFVERLRFRPMSRRDWRYSLLALVVIGLLTSGIMIAMQVLFSDFNHTPSFMTLDPLSPGRYWLLLAWFPYWLLNIGGEEFFWRGVLLPRQEKDFRRQNVDITWHWLGYFSYSVWLATTCYVITAIVYRALCGTKDTEHMDRSISTWGNQWS
ncbi:CPBP family intramembrane metalloprotease [Bacteroides thetaiotaomicron]|nr:CPBP family intramembrane metalloprotease [Bacteroides thetaiotaomicron]